MLDLRKTFISVIGCELSGILGSLITINAIPTWYSLLEKPSFAPPNWLFGPVWTILYLCMGISFSFVWKLGLKKKKVKNASKFFFIQLGLNFIWTPIFFGLRSPFFGLIVIALMAIAIVLTIIKFYQLSKLAAYLLVPYLLWVSFATILNASIFFLN